MFNLISLVMVSMVLRGEASVPAHVQSQYGQLITSSTLSWLRSEVGVALAEGAVSSGTGDGVICRGVVGGILVAGFTSRSRCMVAGSSGQLITLTQYHVLHHLTSASKLRWVTYDKYSPVPAGAVAGLETGDNVVFVGRRLDRGVMRTAWLEMGFSKIGGFGGRIAVYSADEKVELVQQCDLLVEEEPVSYRLNIYQYVKKPKKTSQQISLATSSMFRFEEGLSSVARMTKMVYYTYQKSLYFGHIKGVIKGLPAKIKLPSGEVRTVVWGQSELDKQSESVMVEFMMSRNTAVDIDVVAERVEEEQSWSGDLVSVFRDGSTRNRPVTGVTLVSYLDNIKPRYSNIHQIRQQEQTDHQTSPTEQVLTANTTQHFQHDKIYSFQPHDPPEHSGTITTTFLTAFVSLSCVLINKFL